MNEDSDIAANGSANATFEEIREKRRALLEGSVATLAIGGLPLAGCATAPYSTEARATAASPAFADATPAECFELDREAVVAAAVSQALFEERPGASRGSYRR